MSIDHVELLESILNAFPYPIVFVDDSFVIRYMNRQADYQYHTVRGYPNLIGRNLLDCHHNEAVRQRIRENWEGMKRDGKPRFVSVNLDNQRLYMQPVRDRAGNFIGFFERFELNLALPPTPHR